MKTYDYLTISAETFFQLSNAEAEGYLAEDEEGRAWRTIKRAGYRFVSIHEGKAIFEKETESNP